MNTVLFQECVRYNRLLVEMHEGLALVQRALIGEVAMSEELESMADAIFDNRVPPAWVNKGFLSLKPLASWIVDCLLRLDFLQVWIDKGTPAVYWISGFFFPQAFLTGIIQNYARQNTIAVDKLAYSYEVKDATSHLDIKVKPDSGCLCWGMYLEGCRWDDEKHTLSESTPKKLFVDLPMLHLIPIVDRVKPISGIYDCPVYKVLSRTGTLSTTGHSTNFVMWLELDTGDRKPDEWIVAGVAAFLALRY
jgi:dynein heavy chain